MPSSYLHRRTVARLASIGALLLAILATIVGPFPQPARATTTITRWTFDNDTLTPATGSGTATLVGGTTATFATGRVGPRPPDSGWNTTTYAAQGTGDRTRGVQFAVSTVGYENIVFNWDHRHSNTAANTVALLYSTDGGATFTEAGVYTANAGDAWFSRSFDFSAIAALNNNPGVVFRIVAAFAAGGSTYVASNPGSSYATTGTWRFDNVTVIGSALGADAAPSVSGTNPANGAANVPIASDVTVTFSEPVAVSGDWFTLACATSGTRAVSAANIAVSGGPISFTLNPSVDFAFSETCTLTIVAAQVSDLDASDPPDTMAADVVVTFSTVAPPAPGVRIRDIQGAAHISPLVPVIADNAISFGNRVENVPGIVTVVRPNGFYMQDPEADASDATSEGIFVFTGSGQAVITAGGSGPVQVGDRLEVSGRPVEIRPGCTSPTCTSTSSAWNNLTLTNLNATTSAADNRVIRLISRGNPLPEPVVIGQGGRVPPVSATIFGSPGAAPTNTVETATYSFNPAVNGIDFLESLEGMRVQVNDAVVVGPTNNFGEIVILADNGVGQGLRTPRGGLVITPTDLNPERIILDDAILPTPQVNVGDRFPGAVVGVMDYSFANFKLLITQSPPAVVPGGIAEEVTNLTSAADRLTIATFNIENFAADTVTPGRRDAIARIIVNNLGAPDIVALQEVQDNNGATGGPADTSVDATRTFETLINAIVDAGGPVYAFRQIDPVANQDGGEPGGNIRVAFLFRSDRGLSFVDRPGGSSTAAVSVVNNGGRPELSFSPGRIDPTNPAFNNSRKPLVGEFRYNGQTLFVVNNHFNSKGGDQPLSGRFQPPTRFTEVQRHQQAQIVNDFVDSILAIDPNANIVVLGDLNDFQFSETLNIVKGTPGDVGTPVLFDLKLNQPPGEQYTYIFEGNSQVLDSILVSRNLRDSGAQYDTVHVNTEFAAAANASDHDPSVLRLYVRSRATPPALVATAGYNTGLGANGAEIISVRGNRGVLTNAGDGSIDILDTSDLFNIQPLRRITGLPNLTSAAIHPTKDLFVAVAGTSSPRSGQFLVYRLSDGTLLATAPIGRQPDSVEISPDGRFAVVAIEAEQVNASDDGGAGAIGVADLSGFDPNTSTSVAFSIVELPDLTGLSGATVNRRYDVSGNPLVSNAPGGLEPEGIAFTPDSSTVYVTLQENNAVVRLDLTGPLPATLPVSNAFGLGQTDHPADLINDGTYNPSQQLTAFREPDGIRAVVIGGVTYLVTTDEGDTRPNPRGGRTLSIFNAATGALVADAGPQLDDLAASF
ncbi:MAG: Ig-like domain-containing protein, partial [Chloroflexaceae bacterium]